MTTALLAIFGLFLVLLIASFVIELLEKKFQDDIDNNFAKMVKKIPGKCISGPHHVCKFENFVIIRREWVFSSHEDCDEFSQGQKYIFLTESMYYCNNGRCKKNNKKTRYAHCPDCDRKNEKLTLNLVKVSTKGTCCRCGGEEETHSYKPLTEAKNFEEMVATED